jgi:streptogrisin C
VNGAAQGTFQASSFPGNDYAWVAVNSGWTPQPWVNNYSGGNVTVAGSQEAGIGASVCRSGRTTGWRCGVIQAQNVTINYAAGPVYGATQTNACAEPGDSGGSWVSGTEAQGVTSGGSGDCTAGGETYFQPVNEILSTYGVSLITG